MSMCFYNANLTFFYISVITKTLKLLSCFLYSLVWNYEAEMNTQ